MDPETDYAVRDSLSAVLRLRTDLVITPQPGGQQPGYLIEDPLRGRFFHVGRAEFTVLSLLDGQRTIGDALALAASSLGSQAMGEQDVLAVCHWLLENGLAHTDASAEATRVCHEHRRATSRRRLALLNPLAIRIPLAQPDRMLDGLMPWLGWLTSPACFAAWCVAIGWAGCIALGQWRELADAPLVLLDPAGGLRLLAAWVGLKLWHETMHALFCKKYGGHVSSAGVMLLFFTPVAYVDVTSSWRFRSRWQRIATAAAGMYGETMVGGLALIAWSRLPPGAPRHLAWCVSVMALVHTLVFNANPLMRFDGYYILSDFCGVPNLAARGAQYVSALVARVMLGKRIPLPAWPPRIARIVRVYGLAALAWRTVVYASLSLVLIGWLSYTGALLALVMLAGGLARPLARLWKRLRQPGWSAAIDWRRVSISGGCALGVLGLVATLACWPGQARVPAIVEYAPLSVVRAASPGFVRRLEATDGQQVRAGQVLLVLDNEELHRKLRDVQLELEQATLKSRIDHQSGELAKYQADVAQCESLKKKLVEAQAEVDELTIRARIDGRLVARGFNQLAGRYLKAGEQLGVIGGSSAKEIRLAVDHEDIELVSAEVGRQVTVRVPGADPTRLTATLVRVDPQGTSEPIEPALSARAGGPLPVKIKPDGQRETDAIYELMRPVFGGIAELEPGAAAMLAAGQRVDVTFRTPGETTAGRLRRRLARWIEAQIEKGREQ